MTVGHLFLRATDQAHCKWRLSTWLPGLLAHESLDGFGYQNGADAFIAALQSVLNDRWAKQLPLEEGIRAGYSRHAPTTILSRPGFRSRPCSALWNDYLGDVRHLQASLWAGAFHFVTELTEGNWRPSTTLVKPWPDPYVPKGPWTP